VPEQGAPAPEHFGQPTRNDSPERLISPVELPHFRSALAFAVRQLRGASALSQEALGFDATLHRNYVGAIERGEINPTLRILCQLSDALHVPASDLLALAEHIVAERRWLRPHGEQS
jgi:DNA-binding XRE family transcriptional regulator